VTPARDTETTAYGIDEGGPLGTTPGSRPQSQALAKAPNVTAIVARRSRRLPVANASLYEPAAGRTWWWISLRCPHCGSVHLGRVRTEGEAGGPHRAGCGRMVLVVVRRTYRSHAARQAAA
jgi:hypothetical protein